ncbi:MAG TPA: hypothetical protein VF487_02025 [Chitinophagaceae bacterium]
MSLFTTNMKKKIATMLEEEISIKGRPIVFRIIVGIILVSTLACITVNILTETNNRSKHLNHAVFFPS